MMLLVSLQWRGGGGGREGKEGERMMYSMNCACQPMVLEFGHPGMPGVRGQCCENRHRQLLGEVQDQGIGQDSVNPGLGKG